MGDASPEPSSCASLQFLGRFSSRPPLPLKTPVVLVGSGPQAQVRLKGSGVAAAQALLVCEPSGTFLRALDPAAPTLVNGRAASDAALADGDVVRVGPFEFRHHRPPADAAGGAQTPPVQLELRNASETVAPRDRVTLIGSAQSCDHVLTGEGVAPIHAAIVRTQRGLIVRDLVTPPASPAAAAPEGPAPAATSVNGRAVRQQLLRDGDVLKIGSAELRCTHAAPPPPHHHEGGAPALRPVTSSRLKRRRVALGAAESAPTTDNPTPNPADEEVADEPDFNSEGRPPAGSRRAPVVLPVAMALLCMAAAALAVWRWLPVHHVVQASISFERPPDLPEPRIKELLREQELLLVDEEIRRTAMEKLRARGGNVNEDFLARPAELGRRGGVRHETSAGRAAMVIWVRGQDAPADAARLDALLGAIHERQSAQAGRDVAGLREQLLTGELADLEKEAAWRKRWAEQLRNDLKVLEADAPPAPQLERMRARVAALRQSLESSIEARALAERESRPSTAATAPATAQTTRPEVTRARGNEAKVRAELKAAEEELGRAEAAGRQVADLERRLGELGPQLKELEGSLLQKREQLARTRAEAGPRLLPKPPEAARTVRNDDPRGPYTAAAVAAVAVLFIVGFAARDRRGSAAP